MDLNTYDVVIGYSTIEKYNLLDKLKTIDETNSNSSKHNLFGALLNSEPFLNGAIPHLSEFLSCSGDDGDDISDKFKIDAPWDSNIEY